ncbi:MAG: MBL fold metallo-hydrolase [Candidatus Lokiarchaeota archaeon]|nr:MBL fold metallo-hydrolase [Candidatus Lokiarchaeota archaeon]
MISVIVEKLERKSVSIYRMATLDLQKNPFMWVSAYLIDGLLIDAGHHHAKYEFLNCLNFDEIEYCVVSHHHEDHYGAVYDLIHEYNVPTFSNKETAFLIRNQIKIPPERNLVWGIPKPCSIKQLDQSDEILTTKAKFKILPSPGHCKNLISLYHEKKKLLFSTDAFINNRQSVIFNWEDANRMLDTLKMFLKLNFKYLFLEDGSIATMDDVHQLIHYWSYIKLKSQNLYRNEISTKEIVKQIFGKESILKKMTGGDMSRENLIRSLLNLNPIDPRKNRKTKK